MLFKTALTVYVRESQYRQQVTIPFLLTEINNLFNPLYAMPLVFKLWPL